ncbi:putative mitochondrial protein, partial [Mucuna pruriens]
MLWNDEALNEFCPSRGIRQGDHISPYLFVLCMECLSHLIQSAVNNGYWKHLFLSRRALKLSHLYFANDLILFAKASHDQVDTKRVPILHQKATRRSFNYVMERVNQRRSNWKASLLSLLGRLTLIQSML